jgi:hypothetical protein
MQMSTGGSLRKEPLTPTELSLVRVVTPFSVILHSFLTNRNRST